MGHVPFVCAAAMIAACSNPQAGGDLAAGPSPSAPGASSSGAPEPCGRRAVARRERLSRTSAARVVDRRQRPSGWTRTVSDLKGRRSCPADVRRDTIFKLGTQKTWRSGAELPAIERAVAVLVREAQGLGISTVGLPRIGAGLGGLRSFSRRRGRLPRAAERSRSRVSGCGRGPGAWGHGRQGSRAGARVRVQVRVREGAPPGERLDPGPADEQDVYRTRPVLRCDPL
jgi:hypothetical protein